MAETEIQPPIQFQAEALTAATMRDRYVKLMKDYAALRGKPTPDLLARIIDFQHQVAVLGGSLAGSDARAEAQATINYWQTVRINAGDRPDTMLLADFDRDAALRDAGDRPPYKGLAPFLTGDTAFFSGRFKLVNAVIDMVKSHRLLALTGVSGSGKSSVVRAGLIPGLAGRAYDGVDDDGLTDSSSWAYPPPILPGADPLAALTAAFGPIAVPADMVAALDAKGTAVLMSIDQFEEVFTLSDPGPRRDLFLAALVAAATSGVHRHVIVITMRGEYDSYLLAHDMLGPLFAAGRQQVVAMPASDLRKAIEEPAQRLGVGFEAGLVEELLTRVQGEPAGLPLLSFTLLKLWEARAGGAMTWGAYKALGNTPRDILANSADAVFTGLPLKQDQDLVQGIFTRLAKIGDSLEATSNRVSRAGLDILGARDNVDAVLGKLATAGLIRTSPAGAITPATEIEVAHEALIRNWGRLTEWVKDDFARQTNRRAFTLRAEKWHDGNGDLLSGISLDEARTFPGKTPVEDKYIAASLRHFRNRKRRILLVTLAFAIVAAFALFSRYQLAQKTDAERAQTRLDALIARADQLIATGDTLLAKKVMLSGLGEGEAPPPQMAAALQAAALNEVDEQLLTAPGAGAAKGLSLDGALMSLWGDGKARVWQAQIRQARTGKPLVLEIPGRSITAAALSPDGRHAATASVASGNTADADAVAHVEFWSLSGATAGTTVQFRSYAVGDLLADIRSIKYHPGGKRVILASGSGPALLIATANGDLQRVIGDETGATTAVFSPKGDAILVADTQGGVGLFGADGAPVPNFRAVQVDKGVVTTARFTESGARFVVGTDKGKLSVYSAVSGEKLMTLPGHSKAVTGVAFSPDSSMIVSASKDGTLRLWEHGITAGHLLRTLRTTRPDAATSAVNAVAFGTDGDTIVAARENGTISMLDLAGKKLIRKTPAGREQLIPRTPGGQGIWRALSTRAQVIATLEPLEDPVDVFGDVFFAVAAWHAGSDRPVARIKVRNPYDIMFSDDGTRLAVLDEVGDGFAISIVATEGGALMTRQPIFIPAPPNDTSAGKNGKDIPVWTSLSADGTVMIIVMKSSRLVAWRGGDSLVDIPVPRDHPLAVNNAGLLYVDLPIAFSVGGPMRFAMSSQGQPMVAIHDGTTGKLSAQVKSAGNVETMLFAPDGRTIFVGNDDGSGAIFDTATGRVRVRLDGRHDNAIGYAAFNADGTMLVTASIDGAARLWLTSDGSLLHALVDDGNSIADAEFSHDGKRLITGAENRIATLWDVATGKPLTVLPGPLKSGAITGWFSRDDKRAITLSDDTTLRTWNIDTPVASYDSLFRNVCNNGGLATDDRSDAGIDSAARQVCRDRAQPANGTWRDRMMKRLGLRR